MSSQNSLDKLYTETKPNYIHNKYSVKRNLYVEKLKNRFQCNGHKIFNVFLSLFPVFQWLPKYKWKNDILLDLFGGITVGFIGIPQAMAYAKLAGMDSIVGLYTQLLPPLVYFVFGSSRHASLGTVAFTALMMGDIRYHYIPCCGKAETDNTTFEALLNFNGTSVDTEMGRLTPTELGTTISFLVGVYLITMGIFRVDLLTTYMSDQVVSGFTVGAAVHIITGQIDSVFGIKAMKCTGVGKIFKDYIHLFSNIQYSNGPTIIVSSITFVFLAILKFFITPLLRTKCGLKVPLPGEIIVVVTGILVSYFTNMNQKYNVETVGYIPSTLPYPSLPRFNWCATLAIDSLVVAIITYCQNISQVKMYARMHNYEVDNRQEFFAYGATNLSGSFFQCFNSGLSISRTIVYEKTGAKTQLASFFSAIIVILTILFISPYLSLLPQGCLAATIIVACIESFRQLQEMKSLWFTSKVDFAIYLMTFISIVVLDVTYGLLVGVVFALLSTIFRTQCLKISVNAFNSEDVVQNEANNDLKIRENDLKDIKIVRFEAPLYFANSAKFKQSLMKKCFSNSNENGNRLYHLQSPPRHLIIDCSGFIYVDMMGVNALKQIFFDMNEKGATVHFAHANYKVKKMLDKCGFFESVSYDHFFVSVDEAVVSISTKSEQPNTKSCENVFVKL